MAQHPTRGVFLSRHHLLAKSRGGKLHPSNTLRLWMDSHRAWHGIFANRNLPEIISFLLSNSNELSRKYMSKEWKFLFKKKTIVEVVKILRRIERIKSKL